MKRITFRPDEQIIDAARSRARARQTTLGEEFRAWLDDYVARGRKAEKAINALRELQQDYTTAGRKFTRDELNER